MTIFHHPGMPTGPVHPGVMLRVGFLDRLKITPRALALTLEVNPPRIYDLLKGKNGMTAEIAVRLARYFSETTPQDWMNLQRDFEVAELRPKIQAELDAIQPHGGWPDKPNPPVEIPASHLPVSVELYDGKILISVGIHDLADFVPDLVGEIEAGDGGPDTEPCRVYVKDEQAFAGKVVDALQREANTWAAYGPVDHRTKVQAMIEDAATTVACEPMATEQDAYGITIVATRYQD